MEQIEIRPADIPDAAEISGLTGQLGYKMAVVQTSAQVTHIRSSGNDDAFVAVSGGQTVGWMQVSYLVRLETTAFCEITGLVVDEQHRGKGIGKALVQVATEWCASRGCERLVVRSNAVRTTAHAFYTGNGFEEQKQQKVFVLHVKPAIPGL